MTLDPTVDTAVYSKSDRFVVGAQGRLSIGVSTIAAQNPASGTLSAHTTSATIVGTDTAGIITIVTDATGTAANVNIFVVTFAIARLVLPTIQLSNQSPGAGSATTYPGSYGATIVGAGPYTGFTVQCLSALTASSSVVLGYLVVDQE